MTWTQRFVFIVALALGVIGSIYTGMNWENWVRQSTEPVAVLVGESVNSLEDVFVIAGAEYKSVPRTFKQVSFGGTVKEGDIFMLDGLRIRIKDEFTFEQNVVSVDGENLHRKILVRFYTLMEKPENGKTKFKVVFKDLGEVDPIEMADASLFKEL